MSYRTRIWIVIATALSIGVSTLFLNPVPQDPAFHLFADSGDWLGVPNFGNVVSNLVFPLVGLAGLCVLYGGGSRRTKSAFADSLPYAVFLAAVALVGAGSAYYHWHPDNRTLFWDRLPMTLGFMSLTAAVIADRVHRAAGLKIMLPVLLAAGIASVLYWSATEAAGRGDLRYYGLVQFLPMILVPLICWLFPDARWTKGRYIAGMILCYGIAKLFEYFDYETYDLLGESVSGHTLKHFAAAAATAFVIPMCRVVRESGRSGLTKSPEIG